MLEKRLGEVYPEYYPLLASMPQNFLKFKSYTMNNHLTSTVLDLFFMFEFSSALNCYSSKKNHFSTRTLQQLVLGMPASDTRNLNFLKICIPFVQCIQLLWVCQKAAANQPWSASLQPIQEIKSDTPHKLISYLSLCPVLGLLTRYIDHHPRGTTNLKCRR